MTKSIFLITVIPKNPGYSPETFTVDVPKATSASTGQEPKAYIVYKMKKRVRFIVAEKPSGNIFMATNLKAVPNAEVTLKIPGAEIYSFADTARYLQGNEVYRYAVRTVNDVDQLSDFSEAASASPGKKATVGSPMNLRITKTGSGILLVWDDMRETEPVLLGYKVFRREEPDARDTLLPGDTLRNDLNYYRDTALVAGKTYRYTVSAIDFYGNESAGSVSVSYVPEASFVIPPEITRAVNTEEGILISWGQVTDEKVVLVKVYRSRSGMQALPVFTLQKTSDEYLDKTVTEGELYTYEISVITEGDRESARSRGVTVRREQGN